MVVGPACGRARGSGDRHCRQAGAGQATVPRTRGRRPARAARPVPRGPGSGGGAGLAGGSSPAPPRPERRGRDLRTLDDGPDDRHWDAAWRRLVAACAEARRRTAAGGPVAARETEYPAIAPPPPPSPERPVIRDDLAVLASFTRAYVLSHASAAPALTVGLLVTSRGPGDLAFGVNILPEASRLPPGGIAPPVALEASRALLTAPIVRVGLLVARPEGRLAFEPAAGFEPPGGLGEGGEPADLAGLLLAAFARAAET